MIKANEKKNIILLGTGKTVSLLGTNTYTFIMGLYLLNISGEGESFVLNLLFGVLPSIFISPIAGYLADKRNRKKMIIILDLLSGIFLIIIFMISKISLTYNIIYFSTFILNLIEVIFGIAFTSAIPNMFSKDRLGQIFSLDQTISSATRIVSPIIAGFLIKYVDIRTFIIFNGISFILSAITECFIYYNKNNNDVIKKNERFIDSMKLGMKYLHKNMNLSHIVKYLMLINVFFAFFNSLFPYLINQVYLFNEEKYGFIQSSLSIGALITSTILVKKNLTFSYNKLRSSLYKIFFLWLLTILPSLMMATFSKFIIFVYLCIIGLGLGYCIIIISIPLNVAIQLNIDDDDYRGRMVSFIKILGLCINPIVYLFLAFVIDKISYLTLISASLVYLLIVIISIKIFEKKKGS